MATRKGRSLESWLVASSVDEKSASATFSLNDDYNKNIHWITFCGMIARVAFESPILVTWKNDEPYPFFILFFAHRTADR